jgi:CIC family chloride channel protein
MALEFRQPNEPYGERSTGLAWQIWALVLPIGILSGLAGAGLLKLLHLVEHTIYSPGGSFLEAVQRASGLHRALALLIAGVLVAGWALPLRQPIAGHSGGLADAIWFRAGAFPLIKTLGRAVLTIVVVGIGASLGREGALKQTGAAIGSSLSGWLRLTDPQRRLLAACGAAGGFAAAYNVPFGAALFSLEILLGVVSIEPAVPVLLTSVIAALSSHLVLPDSVTYQLPQFTSNASLIVWSCIFGPVFGLAGALFVRAFAKMEAIEPEGKARVWMPLVVLTGLGVLAIWFPQLLGNGKDIVQTALLGKFPIYLLFVLPALKFLAVGLCAGSGVPGGLFTPTMSVGALMGGFFGAIWAFAWPGTQTGCYPLLGMAALFSAVAHGPITSIVLVIELTGAWHLIPALLLVCGSATAVARWMEARTIYTARFERHIREGLAAAKASADGLAKYLVEEVEPIPSAIGYQTAMSGIKQLRSAFPPFVVDDRGHLLGQILNEALPDTIMSLHAPLDCISAGDVALPCPDVLTEQMGFEEIRKRLVGSGAPCLPVIDSQKRLVGAISPKSLGEG